jgi:uncharacterized membrane protein YkvA (DUF1232 family)
MKRLSSNKLVNRLRRDIELYKSIILHPACPRITRILLGAAIAYAISPIDLIPDFIPVLGYVDDLLILPLLVYIAFRTVPDELLEEVRAGI